MTDTEIRILVVEDEALIAEDIATSLNAIDYRIAGIAYSSEKALDLLHSQQPDLVLLDIQIKGSQSGIDLAKIINEKYRIPFIYLTSFADKVTVDQAKKTMPYGYVLKPFSERELFSSIEVALYRFSRESRKMIPALEAINQMTIAAITPKEYEILSDLCEGLTNQQLSEKHFISINTVKSHVKQILLKFDVPNRTSVIRKVFR